MTWNTSVGRMFIVYKYDGGNEIQFTYKDNIKFILFTGSCLWVPQ